MNWIKVDEAIFDHVGKRISAVLLSPAGGGRITEHRALQVGVDYDATLKVHPNYHQGLRSTRFPRQRGIIYSLNFVEG
jgi:hypothetical protein